MIKNNKIYNINLKSSPLKKILPSPLIYQMAPLTAKMYLLNGNKSSMHSNSPNKISPTKMSWASSSNKPYLIKPKDKHSQNSTKIYNKKSNKPKNKSIWNPKIIKMTSPETP